MALRALVQKADGGWCLELPFYPQNLREWMGVQRDADKSAELIFAENTRVLHGVCEGLHALHAVGILHRY
jgi:hypothetical protein